MTTTDVPRHWAVPFGARSPLGHSPPPGTPNLASARSPLTLRRKCVVTHWCLLYYSVLFWVFKLCLLKAVPLEHFIPKSEPGTCGKLTELVMSD